MENKIIDGLYLGDYGDATKWSDNKLGRIICVLSERPSVLLPGSVWIPILDVDCGDHTPEDDRCRANAISLNRVSTLIDDYLAADEQVLVHCGLGRDRSPLAVAWYLHKKNRISLEEAYATVTAKRPIAAPHLNWVMTVEVDGKPHEVGDKDCHEGWCGGAYGYPRSCGRSGCDGLVHAEFGDEDSDCNFWLYTKCDKCGEPERS